MIKEGSDFFQNSKFYPSLNIYNYLDGQFFNFAWVANSTLSCTVSYFFFLFSIDSSFFDSNLSIHSSPCLFKNYTTVLIRLVWIDIWFYLHHLYSHSSPCLFKNYTTVLIRHSFHYATPATRHLVALGGLGKRVHLDVFTTSTSSSLPRKIRTFAKRSQLDPRYQ